MSASESDDDDDGVLFTQVYDNGDEVSIPAEVRCDFFVARLSIAGLAFPPVFRVEVDVVLEEAAEADPPAAAAAAAAAAGGERQKDGDGDGRAQRLCCAFSSLTAEAAHGMVRALTRLRDSDLGDSPARLGALRPVGTLCELFAVAEGEAGRGGRPMGGNTEFTCRLRGDEFAPPFCVSSRSFVCTYVDWLMRGPAPAGMPQDSGDYDSAHLPRMFVAEEVLPRIVHVRTERQIALASAFVRFQDHYEGSSARFRGQMFTLAAFKEWYCLQKPESGWTYYIDWPGFNLPSPVLERCARGMLPLRPQERALLGAIRGVYPEWDPCGGAAGGAADGAGHPSNGAPFYVIGTTSENDESSNTLNHELAHGLYFTDPEYKAGVDAYLEALPASAHDEMRKQLLQMGYCDVEAIVADEKQAYMVSGGLLSKEFLEDLERHAPGERELIEEVVGKVRARWEAASGRTLEEEDDDAA